MAHDIEGNFAFFASGLPAWHNLGTVLKDAPSVEEAWRLAYPFEVFKLTAAAKVTDDQGNSVYSDSPDHSAIVRSDGKHLSYASNAYEVVQPFQIFDSFSPLIDSGLVELEAGGSLSDGKRIWGLGKIKNSECEILPGDPIKAYMLFHSSFDGSLTTGFKHTGVRVVCANTLAQAMRSQSDFTSRHTVNTHARIEDYVKQVEAMLHGFSENVAIMKALARKKVSREAQIRYIGECLLTKPELELVEKDALPTKTMNKVRYVVDLLDTQRGLELIPAMRDTAWQAYNAISEYVTHEAGRTDDSRVNSQWFGAGAQLNNKAMALAQTL